MIGVIHEVTEEELGTNLATDALIGDEWLILNNVDDFAESGTLLVDGVILDYVSIDHITHQVFLLDPLTANIAIDTALAPMPSARIKTALVKPAGSTDDALFAAIPQFLYDKISSGIRTEEAREVVTLDVIYGRWTITDVLNRAPVVDSQYVTPSTDGVAPDEAPIVDALAGISSIFLVWSQVVQADPVLYDVAMHTSPVDPDGHLAYPGVNGITMVIGSFPDGTPVSTAAPTYFWVRAVDEDGAGPWSDVASSTALLGVDGAALEIRLDDLDTDLADLDTALGDLDVELTSTQGDLDTAEAAIDVVEAKFPITAPDIASNAVESAKIATGAVLTAKLADAAVQTAKIAPLAVTTAELNALAVTTAKIAANAVTTTQIINDAVDASKIAALAVGSSELAAGAVIAGKITALTIVAGDIAANTITAAKIAALTITAAEIAATTITAAKIVANTLTANEIAANAITASELAANAVVAGKILAGTIVAADIATGTITTTQIAANTIAAVDIAAATITSTEIAAGTITASNILSNTITATQIAALTITAAQIAATTITAAKIVTGTITALQIAAGTITTTEILAGTILAANIAAGTITATQIAAGTITAAKIATETITANEIAAGTLTATQIATGAITADTLSADAIDGMSISGLSLTIGTKIRLNPTEGLYVEQPNGGKINFPADGTDAIVQAKLLALSLSVTDNASFYGTNNKLIGTLTASNGIPDPGVAPSLAQSWPRTLNSDLTRAYTGALGSDVSGTYWLVPYGLNNHGNFSRLLWITKSTLATAGNASINTTTADPFFEYVTNIGGTIYAVRRELTGPSGDGYYIFPITSSGPGNASVGTRVFLAAPRSLLTSYCFGTDGTSIIIAEASTGDNQVLVTRRNPATGSLTSTNTLTFTTQPETLGMKQILTGSFDYGGTRYIVATDNASGRRACVFNSAGGFQGSETFSIDPGQIPVGLGYDGTRFWTTDSAGFSKYSTARTISGTYFVKQTWYDGNPTGTTHETAASPSASIVLSARAYLTVTGSPAPQTTTGTDDANLVRFWIGTATGTTKIQTAQPALGIISQQYDAFDTAGGNAPTTSTFVGGTFGVGTFQSTNYVAGTSGWMLKGDGTWDLGDTGWQNLLTVTGANWSAYGAGFQVPQYRKLWGNKVEFRGLIQRAAGGTLAAGGGMWTMGTGFRPVNGMVSRWLDRNGTFTRFDMPASGAMLAPVAINVGDYIFLDGLAYWTD